MDDLLALVINWHPIIVVLVYWAAVAVSSLAVIRAKRRVQIFFIWKRKWQVLLKHGLDELRAYPETYYKALAAFSNTPPWLVIEKFLPNWKADLPKWSGPKVIRIWYDKLEESREVKDTCREVDRLRERHNKIFGDRTLEGEYFKRHPVGDKHD